MKYLIAETTPEERKALVEKAFMISLSGAEAPSQETIELVNQYIRGEKELEEVQRLVVEKYTQKENVE